MENNKNVDIANFSSDDLTYLNYENDESNEIDYDYQFEFAENGEVDFDALMKILAGDTEDPLIQRRKEGIKKIEELFKESIQQEKFNWEIFGTASKIKEEYDVDQIVYETICREIASKIVITSLGSPNVSLVNKLFHSTVITNVAKNDNILTLVDSETMSICDVNIITALGVLKKEEAKNFKEFKIIRAVFEYSPFVNSILYPLSNGLIAFNTYQPPSFLRRKYFKNEAVAIREDIPEIYKSFFNHLTNGDAESFNFLINWISYALKGRNPTYLGLVGAQGTGKTLCYYIFQKLIGEANTKKVRDSILKNRFNSSISDASLIFIDELSLDLKSNDQKNRLKDLVNDYIEVEKKGQDTIQIKNHANIMFASNNFDGIPLDEENRRISLIELTDTPIIDSDFAQKYKAEDLLDERNIEALGCYLYGRNVKKSDVHSPFVSRTNQRIFDALKKDWEEWFFERWIPERRFLTSPTTILDFQESFRKVFPNMTAPGRTKIEELARRNNNIFEIKKDNGSTPRYFKFKEQSIFYQ